MSKQRVICVLGMHRSGTSCLMGCLEQAGVFLGDVSRRNAHNPKGNHESPRIVALHEQLLRSSGGAWDQPPQRVVWTDECRRTRDAIIADYSKQSLWGFKDPRTLLTLSGWLDALPELVLVGTFRNPLAVARSLQSRDHWSLERGIRLWLHYNALLRDLAQSRGVPLISFDLPPEQYKHKLVELCGRLDLPEGRRAGGFFEETLRRNAAVPGHAGAPELPEAARDMLDALNHAAI